MTGLIVRNLRAGYGAVRVVNGISLEVRAGEVVALVGRNGAGKTTALLGLLGLLSGTTSDELTLDGKPLSAGRTSQSVALGLAMAPQGRQILSNLTVEENLVLGSASGRTGIWTLDTVYDLFPELADRRKAGGTNLSGGQQQMLCIGRALMANPRVLLLDEPSEGLSPVLVDRLADVLGRLRDEGLGVLLVEQHLNLVRVVGDRYAILEKGLLAGTGEIKDADIATLRAELAL